MDLKSLFIKYRVPSDLVFIKKENISIYEKSGSSFFEKDADDSFRLSELGSYDPAFLQKSLKRRAVALIVNSTEFIFNIFTFEKIPKKRALRDELIEWQLSKLVPEKIENYLHNYYILSKNNAFSVVIKKDIKTGIEKMFQRSGINAAYIGCSTIEIMNGMKRRHINADIIFENNGNQATLLFMKNYKPGYIRKIRFNSKEEAADGLVETAGFVKKNHGINVRNVLICNMGNVPDLNISLRNKNISIIKTKLPEIVLPG